MGIVYLAKDPLIGRLVALKTIRPAAHVEDDETREFQQRFIREAQAAGILNHPGIVTVHDIGQEESSGISFIAMEFVEGSNLKEILAQGRALSFDQIGDIISQVADAIDFAHTKGIIHRDVKPANIILLEGNRAKITDFGIAKIASGVANLTTTGQFLGTPNYMAPEQIKGTPVDGRTDIFSLGICLYECLTRRKPFGGDSLTTISYKIVHEPFPPIHEINPQIPEGYEEVVAKALAKDPARRYQRGREMASALRAVVRGERPAPVHEPLLHEETVITRDRLPTMEMPFPDGGSAAAASSAMGQRPAAMAAAGGSPAATVAMPVGLPRPAAPREPLGVRVRRTVSGVRALPMWRRRISFRLATGVVAASVALLSGLLLVIKGDDIPVPVVDRRAEAMAAQERGLRTEGNALLLQGRIAEAHERYEALYKLAPDSPYVIDVMQKLSAIRVQQETNKQQLALAQQRRDEGIAFVNEKRFLDAVPLLQESFSLNPSDEATAEYLKFAQQEEQKASQARTQPQKKAPTKVASAKPAPSPPVVPAGGDGGRVVNNTPASLTTFFNSPFSDGSITVRIGADTVTNESLFQERGRGIFRRKVARVVNTTTSFAPRSADLVVSVVVPSQRINDQRIISHNFQPGSTQRLVVSFNPQSKTFDYQLN